MTISIQDQGISFGNTSAAPQLFPITCTVAANSLLLSLAPTTLTFRNPSLSSGTPVTVICPTLSITVPSGATLGTTSNVSARLGISVAYNGGVPVLCVSNSSGVIISESGFVSPTAITSGATSRSTIYSASTVSANSPVRVIGYIDIVESVAGVWAASASLVQGSGDSDGIPYMPFGAGAVAGTVQGKLRESVSVLDFYANGVSGVPVDPAGVVDSTFGIQSAIDYVANLGGGVVYLPTGNYKITAQLNMKSAVALVGAAMDATTIRYYGTGGTAIDYAGTSPNPIVKAQLINFGLYDYGTGVNGLNMSYSHYCVMDRLRIYGFGVGLAAANCWNNDAVFVTAENCTQDGFNLTSTDANAFAFTSCQGVGNGRAGLYISGGRSITSLGSTWEANGQYGVYISGEAAARPLGVSIYGGYIEGNGTYEIYIDSPTAYEPRGINLNGVYFCGITGKATQAIRTADVNGLTIDGCTFDNQGATYAYSLYMAAGGNISGVKWGNNQDTSTNGVYSEVYYENEKRLQSAAWGRFTVSGGTISTSEAFGIASITYAAVGVYEVTLKKAMPSTNYCSTASAENATSYVAMLCSAGKPISTTVFRIYTATDAATLAEARTVNFVVFA